MFEKENRQSFNGAKVKDIIKALMQLPADADFYFCGSASGYIHVGLADKVVSFDYDGLDEDYGYSESVQ